MAKKSNIDVLNRLLELEYRSLPMYLTGVSPWMRAEGEARAAATLAHLVTDEKQFASRLASLIAERGGQVDIPGFPMEFTDMNMLALDYLIREVINRQRFTIEEIEECIGRLGDDAEARHLAEEVLGCERGHLENLEELTKVPSPS